MSKLHDCAMIMHQSFFVVQRVSSDSIFLCQVLGFSTVFQCVGNPDDAVVLKKASLTLIVACGSFDVVFVISVRAWVTGKAC